MYQISNMKTNTTTQAFVYESPECLLIEIGTRSLLCSSIEDVNYREGDWEE